MFSSSSESDRNNNSTFNNNHNNFFQAQNHNLNPNQTTTSGLARFRSAPSSFFEALLDSAATDNNSSTSSGDESEANIFFSAFMNGPPLDLNQKDNINDNMKQEVIGVESELRPRGNGYENAVIVGGGAVVGSYDVRMEGSTITNPNPVRLKSSGITSNLVRQSSSPAGFLNGFSVMGEVGNYKFHNHSEASSSASGLSNHHINFSSAPSSNLRFMPSIPEAGNSPENGRLRNDNNTNGREFEASTFPHDSWTESPFNSLKRNREGDLKMFSTFNGLENQNGETRKSSSSLVHHMSLPNNYSEMGASEKVLQFQQDVVPCQIRAKRGFATHPRSIAERVRRTKISEKMKKLQDLFPDMDKQINTAEMLDLAVEFIKDLQKQVKTLTDIRAKCVCPNKSKESSHTT